MRGRVQRQASMFVAYNVEDRIPEDHPLRQIKAWADHILQDMRRDFDAAYAKTGRPGIPPEQLLKAMLLRALYSISSEARLMEALEFNLLYRWFVDLPGDAEMWAEKVFSMNRDRFMAHDLVRKFFDRVVGEAMKRDLVSHDHFTVDGTLNRDSHNDWISFWGAGHQDFVGDADLRRLGGPEELTAWILKQTDSSQISRGSVRLLYYISLHEPRISETAVEGKVKIYYKLKSGWDGLTSKIPLHETRDKLLYRQIGTLAESGINYAPAADAFYSIRPLAGRSKTHACNRVEDGA